MIILPTMKMLRNNFKLDMISFQGDNRVSSWKNLAPASTSAKLKTDLD